MKRYLTCILALALACPAMPADKSADELSQFKTFIEQHPRALDELKKEPSLIANPEFARSHKVVGEYLSQHPKVKDLVKASPHFFDNLNATTKGGEHHPHPGNDGGRS